MPNPTDAARIPLARLAQLAGVDTDETAYRLLRMGRRNGHPETSGIDPRRVAAVAVLARLEALMAVDDRYLEQAARLIHDAAGEAGLVGAPRAIVVPVESIALPMRKPPAPVLTTRGNVGSMLAGRSGFVIDLGSVATDWSQR